LLPQQRLVVVAVTVVAEVAVYSTAGEVLASTAAAWGVAVVPEALRSVVDSAVRRPASGALTAEAILPDLAEDDFPEAVIETATVEV
jgi:hypothetical protein